MRAAGAAVLLGDEEAEVALLREELDVVPRHFRILVPARGAVLEDFAGELLRFVLEELTWLSSSLKFIVWIRKKTGGPVRGSAASQCYQQL